MEEPYADTWLRIAYGLLAAFVVLTALLAWLSLPWPVWVPVGLIGIVMGWAFGRANADDTPRRTRQGPRLGGSP